MIVAFSFLSLLNDDYKEAIIKFNELDPNGWIHYDVMDGDFVPNRTFDSKLINDILKYNNCFNDVHLMINNLNYNIDQYLDMGIDQVTFHYEAIDDDVISDLINKIKNRNIKVGISIKPHTPVEMLNPFLPMLDYILVMSVEPGKGGQSFIQNSLDKIKYLKNMQKNHSYLIGVDGGINEYTSKLVKEAGADVVVIGTYLANNLNINTIKKCK